MDLIKRLLFPFVSGLFLLLFSCSGPIKKTKKTTLASPVSKMVLPTSSNLSAKASQKSAREHLSEVVALAQEKGEEAVKFLSGDLFFKAADASMRGEADLAAILYEQILVMNPTDFYLKKKLAVEYVKLNKLTEAKTLLESLEHHLKGSEEGVSLTLAGIYSVLGEVKKARTVYRSILKKHPTSEEPCIFLAKSYALEKKYKKSYSLLRKCDKRNKGRGIYFYYAGKIALEQGKKKSATRFFEKSLDQDPSYYQSAMALGYLLEEAQLIKGAIVNYKMFLEKNPNSFPVLSRLVHIYFTQGNHEEVFPYAIKLSSLDPDDLNLKVKLGILYTERKLYDQAKGVFKEILVAIPDSDKVLYYLGSLYSETKNYEQAMNYFGKVEAESSLYTDSNLQIAQILYGLASNEKNEQGEWHHKFFAFAKKAGKISPSLKVELQGVLAGYYENLDQVENAISALEEASGLEGFGDDHKFYLASLFEKIKNYKKSEAIIEEIIKNDPDNAHALNFLGYSLLERGIDLARSYQLISKAVGLRPDDGYIRDSLGWYYFKTGEIEKAFTEIKKAWELVKTDATITKHLATIYRNLKEFDHSHKFYMEALGLCKGKTEKEEILKEMKTLEGLKRLPASK